MRAGVRLSTTTGGEGGREGRWGRRERGGGREGEEEEEGEPQGGRDLSPGSLTARASCASGADMHSPHTPMTQNTCLLCPSHQQGQHTRRAEERCYACHDGCEYPQVCALGGVTLGRWVGHEVLRRGDQSREEVAIRGQSWGLGLGQGSPLLPWLSTAVPRLGCACRCWARGSGCSAAARPRARVSRAGNPEPVLHGVGGAGTSLGPLSRTSFCWGGMGWTPGRS